MLKNKRIFNWAGDREDISVYVDVIAGGGRSQRRRHTSATGNEWFVIDYYSLAQSPEHSTIKHNCIGNSRIIVRSWVNE